MSHHSHTYSSVQPRTRVMLDTAMMRTMLADVGSMRTALDLEIWASWMLGQAWKQRTRQPQFAEVDWMLTLGAPIVAMIAEIGGSRARKALTAISLLERGALGNYAGVVALTLPGAPSPPWLTDIVEARFAGARHGVSTGDGEAVLLDLHRRGEPALSVAVFIDDRNDGVVKWIRLLGPVPAQSHGDSAWDALEAVDLSELAGRLCAAIARTDARADARVEPEFADLRAFLLARLLDVTG